jgi:hypothetical protein
VAETLILDTAGTVFDDFNPVEWEWGVWKRNRGDERICWNGRRGAFLSANSW